MSRVPCRMSHQPCPVSRIACPANHGACSVSHDPCAVFREPWPVFRIQNKYTRDFSAPSVPHSVMLSAKDESSMAVDDEHSKDFVDCIAQTQAQHNRKGLKGKPPKMLSPTLSAGDFGSTLATTVKPNSFSISCKVARPNLFQAHQLLQTRSPAGTAGTGFGRKQASASGGLARSLPPDSDKMQAKQIECHGLFAKTQCRIAATADQVSWLTRCQRNHSTKW
jgi:hypothetical protein